VIYWCRHPVGPRLKISGLWVKYPNYTPSRAAMCFTVVHLRKTIDSRCQESTMLRSLLLKILLSLSLALGLCRWHSIDHSQYVMLQFNTKIIPIWSNLWVLSPCQQKGSQTSSLFITLLNQLCVYIYIYVYIYTVYIHILMCTCMWMCLCMLMCVYIYTYYISACIYIYNHISTHETSSRAEAIRHKCTFCDFPIFME